MTSSNPTFFSEDFDLNLQPIQNSLLEKFRSYLGQNAIPSSKDQNECNVFEESAPKEEKAMERKKEKSSTAVKKFKKGIFDADITIAEMLEKTSRFPTKKIEKKPKTKKTRSNNNIIKDDEKEDNLEEELKEKQDSEEFLKKDDELIKPERITCLSFKKAPALKISKWSDEDTNKFYKGLQRYGTDFSMINTLFPEKSRIQIKNKYQRETKENPSKVEKNLQQRKLLSEGTGGKLIELDRHMKKSHIMKDNSDDSGEEKDNPKIPEISLEDLIPMKNSSTISHDAIEKNINEQIYRIIKNETEILKQDKNIKSLF